MFGRGLAKGVPLTAPTYGVFSMLDGRHRELVTHLRQGTAKYGLGGFCCARRPAAYATPRTQRAMQLGFSPPDATLVATAILELVSPSSTVGLGLRGTKGLVDEFEIVSTAGRGTTVALKKWKA